MAPLAVKVGAAAEKEEFTPPRPPLPPLEDRPGNVVVADPPLLRPNPRPYPPLLALRPPPPPARPTRERMPPTAESGSSALSQ